MDIVKALDELAEYQAQVDALSLQKRALLESAVPADVKARMDEIEAEFVYKSSAAQDNISRLEAEIKEAVKAEGKSVKATLLHAVFAKGRETWDSKGLDGLLVAIPQLAQFRKEGEPSVAIRKV